MLLYKGYESVRIMILQKRRDDRSVNLHFKAKEDGWADLVGGSSLSNLEARAFRKIKIGDQSTINLLQCYIWIKRNRMRKE